MIDQSMLDQFYLFFNLKEILEVVQMLRHTAAEDQAASVDDALITVSLKRVNEVDSTLYLPSEISKKNQCIPDTSVDWLSRHGLKASNLDLFNVSCLLFFSVLCNGAIWLFIRWIDFVVSSFWTELRLLTELYKLLKLFDKLNTHNRLKASWGERRYYDLSRCHPPCWRHNRWLFVNVYLKRIGLDFFWWLLQDYFSIWFSSEIKIDGLEHNMYACTFEWHHLPISCAF